jgi:hypothetical protein
MTTPLLAIVPLLAGLCLITPLTQDPAKPTAPAVAAEPLVPGKMDPALLKRLEWICGTWVLQDGKNTTEEHWRPLQGTTILGSSHTYDATRTHFFEHLRIAAMRGTIAYLALPGGAGGTAFTLTTLEDGLMVFENGKHDHPQRIRYERTKDGVTATISQLDGSRATSFVFKRKV